MRRFRLFLIVLPALVVLVSAATIRYRSGGNGTGIPGFVDGTCDDVCFQVLVAEKEPQFLPAFPTYWFDHENGSDTNPCTKKAPCKGLELLETTANLGGAIVRARGLCRDDSAGGCMEGWDGTGFSPPDVPGEPYSLYLLGWDDGGTATYDCAANRSLTGSAGSQPFTLEGDVLVGPHTFEHCPPEPKDATGSLAFHKGIEAIGHDSDVTFLGTRVVEGAAVHYHPIRFSGGATRIAIGVYVRPRDLADFDEDCIGPSCADDDAIPLSLCDDTDDPHEGCTEDSGAGDSQAQGRAHLVESPSDTMVLGSVLDYNNTQHDSHPNPPALIVEDGIGANGADFVVVGNLGIPPASLDAGDAPNNGMSFFAMNQGTAGSVEEHHLAGNTMLAWPSNALTAAFMWIGNSAAASTASTTIHLFQNNMGGGFRGINVAGQFSGDGVSIDGECNNFDEIQQDPAGQAMVVLTIGRNEGSISFDFDGTNVYDTDDGAGPDDGGSAGPDSFRFRSTRYETAQAVSRSNPDADVDDTTINTDWFGSVPGSSEGPFESGGAGIDGNVYGSMEAQGIVSTHLSDCPVTWTIPVGDAFQAQFTPLLGGPLQELHVGTHWQGIGALPEPGTPGLLIGAPFVAALARRASRRTTSLASSRSRRRE